MARNGIDYSACDPKSKSRIPPTHREILFEARAPQGMVFGKEDPNHLYPRRNRLYSVQAGWLFMLALVKSTRICCTQKAASCSSHPDLNHPVRSSSARCAAELFLARTGGPAETIIEANEATMA